MLSECTSKDVYDAYKWGSIPFNSDSAIDFVIPKARSWYIESTISFLHDDAICYEFKVFVDGGDVLQDLARLISTSSQIWLVHICASFTL